MNLIQLALDNPRYAVMFTVLPLLIAAESVVPLLDGDDRWRHTAKNLLIGVIYVATTAVLGLGIVWLLHTTERNQWGLFHWLGGVPFWLQVTLGVIALDFGDYWRHRADHTFRLLWRFHRLHHSDPLMEASTTIRNHPGAAFPILAPRAILIPLLGLPPLALLIHAPLALAGQLYHHSNLRLPAGLERVLGTLIVTPSHHFAHHAKIRKYSDSQYGVLLILWDKLFGTLEVAPERRTTPLGVRGYDDSASQSIVGMLLSVFEKKKPAGGVPTAGALTPVVAEPVTRDAG
ncbi:Sterol desaturase/sphingolipid hydroxylase (Fatty acid hydroxylase superfamily) [Paraburkholderia unamae]|uniref:sterol desaturase family protein n=1 Tax=Paraburkholderia unamae TaxID=219649 RepID=UPI001CB3162A|nr:sterol desaturase family protein [Paraburkholderia unamae]CAG9251925.1 Sterol desaturase/sphingolipid hydroxylase (Fatty acid hydroxylase superfamily) [Paraburkholderia unamae]